MVADFRESDTQSAAYWLEKATAEYKRLAASLEALGSELAALAVVISAAGTAPQAIQPLVTGANEPGVARPPAPSNKVRVNLLGPFRLSTSAHKLPPGTPGQVCTILKYLISNRNRPVSKDALLDLLWPDADPAVGHGRLRVVMHTLRKSVPCAEMGFQDLVVTSGNSFVINPDAELWVDVEEFERHWHRGWRLARSGRAQEALDEYEQAAALYTGDYLEDELYADWTLLRREVLRDAYATILTVLANMSLDAADYTGTIIWAQKLMSQDDCREDAYRLLMTSHQRLGQPSRASFWYGLCARTLQRELQSEPSAETRELFEQITNH